MDEKTAVNVTADSKQLPGAFELFSKSSEIVRRNLKLFAIVYIMPLLSALLSMFSDTDNTSRLGFAMPNGAFSGQACGIKCQSRICRRTFAGRQQQGFPDIRHSND